MTAPHEVVFLLGVDNILSCSITTVSPRIHQLTSRLSTFAV